MRRADNLATFMCRLSRSLGPSTSCSPQGLSRRLQGLLFDWLEPYVNLALSLSQSEHVKMTDEVVVPYILSTPVCFISKVFPTHAVKAKVVLVCRKEHN